MKIFYTASFYGKDKYQRFYDLVLNAIKKSDTDLISPEIGNYFSLLSPLDIKPTLTKKEIHYLAIKKGIQWADAVIIEVSHEDFQLGHEATLAVLAKKPVLCLSINQDFSEKIQNRYFHGSMYSEYTVDEIVQNFLKKVRQNQKTERFNCFLTPDQVQYLETASQKLEVNKSEYLRLLIDKDQEK